MHPPATQSAKQLVVDWSLVFIYFDHIRSLVAFPRRSVETPQLIIHFPSDLPQPKLAGLTAEPVLPPVSELAAKPPQTPAKDEPPTPRPQPKVLRPAMDDPEDDPWGTPDLHKTHAHAPSNGAASHVTNGHPAFSEPPAPTIAPEPISHYAAPIEAPASNGGRQSSHSTSGPGGWGYFDANNPAGVGFGTSPQNPVSNPFGPAERTPGGNPPPGLSQHPSAAGRTGRSVEENIIVTLMPEKEGMFLFQHHNYEISSLRRGSKVIRRYSDFVWLLDCLNKRYPFRVLPLLPPKRMGVNGSHLSNDGAFIEKRRRGLARFLNALVRHPILSQEQLVVMFLTVPTVC